MVLREVNQVRGRGGLDLKMPDGSELGRGTISKGAKIRGRNRDRNRWMSVV
jgi:hypothetical protein